jgi:hypothetical protein
MHTFFDRRKPVINIRTPQLPQLNLNRSEFTPAFFVDMESFFAFSFWMSEELLDLESRFESKIAKRKLVQAEKTKQSTSNTGNKVLPR